MYREAGSEHEQGLMAGMRANDLHLGARSNSAAAPVASSWLARCIERAQARKCISKYGRGTRRPFELFTAAL